MNHSAVRQKLTQRCKSHICTFVLLLSHVQLFATRWTVAHQAPLSMGFSRPEYCSGLPFPPPGDLPNPRVKSVSPLSPASPALTGGFFTTELPGKQSSYILLKKSLPSSYLWPCIVAYSQVPGTRTWECLGEDQYSITILMNIQANC